MEYRCFLRDHWCFLGPLQGPGHPIYLDDKQLSLALKDIQAIFDHENNKQTITSAMKKTYDKANSNTQQKPYGKQINTNM